MKKNRRGFITLIVLVVSGFLAVVGFTSYITYYSIKSQAQVLGTDCVTNRICTSNLQCGRSGRCDFSSPNIDPLMPPITKTLLGRCTCNLPSPKPTSVINPSERWSYNTKKTGMIECKKGKTLPDNSSLDLKTFNTLKECELDLFKNRQDIAKFRCKQRNGIEMSIFTKNLSVGIKDRYKWSFNINGMLSCWTPVLNCGICNGRCADLNVNKCLGPNSVSPKAATNDIRNPIINKQCLDVLGRCVEDGQSFPRPTPVCTRPTPPSGCRYLSTSTNIPDGCPVYKLVCGPTTLITKVPYPTSCPKPIPPPPGCRIITRQTDGIAPTDCPSYEIVCETKVTIQPTSNPETRITPSATTAQLVCIKQGGVWKYISTESGEEGWCIKGKRGCEGNSLLEMTCILY